MALVMILVSLFSYLAFSDGLNQGHGVSKNTGHKVEI